MSEMVSADRMLDELAERIRAERREHEHLIGDYRALAAEVKSLKSELTTAKKDLWLMTKRAEEAEEGRCTRQHRLEARELAAIYTAVRQTNVSDATAFLTHAGASITAHELVLRLFRAELNLGHRCKPPLDNPTREEAIAALRRIVNDATLFERTFPDRGHLFALIAGWARNALPKSERES